MDINNTYSIHKIVKDTLKETSLKQWEFDQFIAMTIWKPNKDNKCIQRFIGRIKEKYENKISDPGERFSYVIVKEGSLYDENGKKQLCRVADYMKFSDIAKELNIEIDISHYLEKTMGLCTHFINNNKRY